MADDTVVLHSEQRRTVGYQTSRPTVQPTEESSFADRYLEYTFDSHRRPKRLPEHRKRRGDHAHCEPARTTANKVKSRSIQWYDVCRPREVGEPGVMWRTCRGCDSSYRWDPGRCLLAGASRAADVVSPHPMDSLTIHGNPLGTTRGPAVAARRPRPLWAETDGAPHRAGRHDDQGGGHRAKDGDAQFVHPPAQAVMARKCGGTDAPGSRPNRNGVR
jgi:hypothetical protein